MSDEKINALDSYQTSPLYNERERAALNYADHITLSDKDVDEAQYTAMGRFFDDDALVELTAVIAWENASSKFNRAFRIGSQGLWQRAKDRAKRE